MGRKEDLLIQVGMTRLVEYKWAMPEITAERKKLRRLTNAKLLEAYKKIREESQHPELRRKEVL